MAADVAQAAMADSASAFGAVYRHVVVTAQQVPRAEVAENWGANLWGASMSSVAMLRGMHHAVNIAGAGRRAPRWGVRSFLMPAGIQKRDGEELNRVKHFKCITSNFTISIKLI